MKHLIVLFFVLFVFHVAAQQSFENKKGGYKISVPEKWTIEQEGDITSVYAPDEGEMDNWKEKLEISIADANDLNLDEAFAFYIEQDLPSMYDNYTILKKGEEVINGLKSKWFVFSFSHGSTVLHNLFFLVLKNNKLFMLQGIAEKSLYPKFEDNYMKIIRSFQPTR